VYGRKGGNGESKEKKRKLVNLKMTVRGRVKEELAMKG
jgi:hypothetical protein